ncbi:hypothetical protein HKX48_004791 [Thoreauomyces humboldtii]|nr:hypothetical protein HKX48_004791 [Thoreauomyces humboldtii]
MNKSRSQQVFFKRSSAQPVYEKRAYFRALARKVIHDRNPDADIEPPDWLINTLGNEMQTRVVDLIKGAANAALERTAGNSVEDEVVITVDDVQDAVRATKALQAVKAGKTDEIRKDGEGGDEGVASDDRAA